MEVINSTPSKLPSLSIGTVDIEEMYKQLIFLLNNWPHLTNEDLVHIKNQFRILGQIALTEKDHPKRREYQKKLSHLSGRFEALKASKENKQDTISIMENIYNTQYESIRSLDNSDKIVQDTMALAQKTEYQLHLQGKKLEDIKSNLHDTKHTLKLTKRGTKELLWILCCDPIIIVLSISNAIALLLIIILAIRKWNIHYK